MSTQLSGLTAVRNALRAIAWPGGGEQVFASSAVIITAGPQEAALNSLRLPICLIRPQDAAVDPGADEEPNLARVGVGIRLIHKTAGDATGQFALIGGANPSTLTSQGRGLLEIEQEMMRAIQFLNVGNSLTIQHRASDMASAVLIEGLGYIAYRDYTFEMWVTEI